MASVVQVIRRRRHRRYRRAQVQTRNRTWLSLLAGILAVLVVGPLLIGLGAVGVVYARAVSRLPEPQETLNSGAVIGPSEIYDSTEQMLLFSVQDPLGDQRTWVSLDSLPPYVGQATLLAEDQSFLERSRGSVFTFIENIVSNFLTGPLEEDSSLTGRLVRNVILPEKDFVTTDERGLEIALIAEINRRYSPEEVLEWHLNTNYYGNEAYGIEAAAQVYLGKSAIELTLDEAALLAAIPTAPQFNPVGDETAARGRQSDMLRRMLAAGDITHSEFEAVINVTTRIRPDAGQTPQIAPDFAIYARGQAETILNAMGLDGAQLISRGGLHVTTTLDLDLYYQAECALSNHVARLSGQLDEPIPALDGGPCSSAQYLPAMVPADTTTPPDLGTIVVLDVDTGEMKAMVGQGNRVTFQPGPVLYPFVYLRGFLNGTYTAASMLLDIPRDYPGRQEGLLYIPNDADGLFRGPLSLRDAMGAGLLVPATQVANVLNINDILRNTIAQMGITSLRDNIYDLSLLEDGGAVSVVEVAHAYSVFAAMGDAYGLPITTSSGFGYHQPIAVKRIVDANGEVLWDYDQAQIALNTKAVLEGTVAYIVNDILADSSTRTPLFGQDNMLEAPRKTAIVSGITGDHLDNWTVGYTPQWVVAVEMRRGDSLPSSLEGFALEGAAPVWRAVMDYIYVRDNLTASDWPRPESIVETSVCDVSGMAPNGNCETHREIFLDAGQFPETDTYWVSVEVNSNTNQLATVNTPAALRDTRVYFIPPPEAREWWDANNKPKPPEQHDVVSRPDFLSSAVILQPGNLEVVSGQVDVRGSIDAPNMNYFQLRYGQGTNPGQWFNITESQTEYVQGTSLGTWDTAGLDGTYVLQLTVVLDDGTQETGTVQVIVDNLPPTIFLHAGEPGQVFAWPDDPVIPLVAEVTDNYGVDRVEFYHNGQFVGTDTEAPFGYDHEINRAGIEEFQAVVFDTVGNSSTSQPLTIEVIRNN